MAFFNFRWPGSKGRGGKAARPARSPRPESIEVMRRRARHRLIGAAVLVLLGVVGFPVLFDTQPRPIPVDTPIEIPDRNKVAPLVVPATVAPSAPAANQGTDVASVSDGEEVVASVRDSRKPAAAAAAPAARLQARTEPKPEAQPEPKIKPAAEPKPEQPKPESKPAPRSDEAARARALLEGRPAEKTAAPAEEARFIVQIGAFADADKAREARQKLERAGIKTYAQVVDTKDGKRTRVRVGPFTGRAEAEKAAGRIKTMDLPASILTL